MNARQIQRLENKKKKMDALNEIKSLNEADRQLKRPYSLVNIKPVVKKKSKLMLYLKHQGETAQVNDTGLPQSRIPLFVSDVRDFLLYIVFNKTCPPYTEPRWCNISKKKIDHTVLLVVEGLSLNDYLKHSHQLPCLRDGFVKMEIVPPSSYSTSLIQELVMSSKHEESQDVTPSGKPQSPTVKTSIDSITPAHTVKSAFTIRKNQTKAAENTTVTNTTSGGADTSKGLPEKENDAESGQSCLPVGDKFPRTMLVLSALQMIEEDYPIPLRGELSSRFSKYIHTKDVYSEVTPQSPLFGLDCEMCKTANDRNELTRVTLVDEQENVIYESLVKPYNTITNYLTPYSGITRALLAPVATRLEDAQRTLIERLPADAILVGQSLNCDLHALKMMHPYVIDTSVIFNTTGVRTHKPKLKTLASHFLGMEIQTNSDGLVGHCSKEDAIAALKLVKLKLSKDPQFGDAVALQKCIRNINSKLSCPAEVRNLWAYFDKIVTKKKDLQVEKTALVLTTEKDTESEYKKYLATYRTKCTLILGNKNATSCTKEKTESTNLNLMNTVSTNLKEDVDVNSPSIPINKTSDTQCVELMAQNGEATSNKSNACDKHNSKENCIDDESSDRSYENNSNNKKKSGSSQSKNNCKRKMTFSSNANQLSNSPDLVELTETEETSSPPSKLKKDNTDTKSKTNGNINTNATRKHFTNEQTKISNKESDVIKKSVEIIIVDNEETINDKSNAANSKETIHKNIPKPSTNNTTSYLSEIRKNI
ncbi:hypothetical protein WDU94_003327 [Cyamophila willieti]